MIFSSPVEVGSLNAIAVLCTSGDEGVNGGAVGSEAHVEHDAQHAQRAGRLVGIQKGADEGVEGGLLHGPMLARQKLHQIQRIIHPARKTPFKKHPSA